MSSVPTFDRTNWPENYYLTFSAHSQNAIQVAEVLKRGGTAALVFWPTLPTSFWGFPVLDGEEHDARFLDPSGALVRGRWDDRRAGSGQQTADHGNMRLNAVHAAGITTADICASFQRSVVEALLDRLFEAAWRHGAKSVGIAGGVSANSRLRRTKRWHRAPGHDMNRPIRLRVSSERTEKT